MKEYEIKVILKEGDIPKIMSALRSLGYEVISRELEVDTYIDLRVCRCVPEDTVLRIRKVVSGGSVRGEVTYKGPREDPEIKVREELSTEVKDPDLLALMFRKLGFKTYVVSKDRVIMKRQGGRETIYLDKVEGLGEFMEFEVMGDISREEFLRELKSLMQTLGITSYEVTNKSYLEMILEGIEA